MATYDPKRPRPSRLSEDPAPVDALLEPAAEPAPAPEPAAEAEDRNGTSAVRVNGSAPAPTPVGGPSHTTEVPVAPAPEVGTTNRAVLYAAAGVAAALGVLLVVLRLRSRRSARTD